MFANYSVVVGDNDENRASAYLYDHTEIVAVVRCLTRPRQTAYLLRTEADSEHRASYLGRYQADRFGSGLYGLRIVAVTQTEALNSVRHFVAEELDRHEETQARVR